MFKLARNCKVSFYCS